MRDLAYSPSVTHLLTRPATLADLRDMPSFRAADVVPPGADLHCVVREARPVGGDTAAAHDVLLCDGPLPDPPPAVAVAVVSRVAPPQGYPIPVFVLDESTSWNAVIEDVSDVLGDQPGRHRAARARAAFRQSLFHGRGFTALAETCRDLIGAPVAVLDDYLDVLADVGVDDPQTLELDTAIAAARMSDPTRTVDAFIDAAPEPITALRVLGHGGRPALVVVTWLTDQMTRSQAAVLVEMVDACAIEWSRQEVRTDTESEIRGDLIRELMAGEPITRDALIRRARHLGADLSGGAIAMLGKLEDPQHAQHAAPDERVTRRFVQQVRAVLELAWPRGIVDWDGDRLLVLLPGPREHEVADRHDIEARAHALSTRVIGATKDAVPGLVLSLAISRYTPEPERLGAALEEASLALSIGAKIGNPGDVVTFEETGTYKLLFQIFADRPDELAAFYEQTLAPLVRYDEQYQTELVTTLATYLEFDCNLAATAASLFTHRHTIRYRLDRIAELCGLDIGRTDDREKLSLGLKSMRLLGKRVPTPLAKESHSAQGS